MPNKDLVKVSISLLPMEDIRDTLLAQYDFADKAGLGVEDFKDLAIESEAATKVEDIPQNETPTEEAKRLAREEERERRGLANDSNHLGGLPPSEYLGKSDGEGIKKTFRKNRDELTELKDELYQLKAELGRKGLVTNYNNYAGFHETFNDNDIIYEANQIGKVVGMPDLNKIIVDGEAINQVQEGDYISVKDKDGVWEPHATRVVNVDNSNMELEMEDSMSDFYDPDKLVLHKDKGRYFMGSYAFADREENMMGPPKYSAFDDDTNKAIPFLINEKNKGLGYTFKVSNFMFQYEGSSDSTTDEGFFCEFSIKAERRGSPPPLVAHLVYEKDLVLFKGTTHKDYEQIMIGKSMPATVKNEGELSRLTFDFRQDGGALPIVREERICIIILPLDPSEINEFDYYQIRLLGAMNKPDNSADLQLNNKFFTYAIVDDGDIRGRLIDDSDRGELYYNYMVRAKEDNAVMPYNTGLYTKRMKFDTPVVGSKVRLTLRINREGMFSSISPSGGYNNDPIRYHNSHPMETMNGIGSITGETVIVGNSFGELSSYTNESVTINKGMYIEEGTPIYRCGYEPQIRIKGTNQGSGYEPLHTLHLKYIMTDRIKRNDSISDRLVFETEDIPEDTIFEEFELQIPWKSHHALSDKDKDEALILHGGIQDLTFSVERG